MNILVVPMLSVDQINADSNYIIIRNMIIGLHKEHNFVLLLNPKKNYVKDDLYKYCKIIYAPSPTSKRDNVITFNPTMMRRICDDHSIQLVFNNTVEQGHNYKNLYPNIDSNWLMRVLNYHHYNIHPSFGISLYNSMLNILALQLIGSMYADINYFHSNHSYKMFTDEYDKLFKQPLTNVHVELGKHGKTIAPVKRHDTYTFIYNHRLAGYKQFKTTIEMFDALYAKTKDFKVLFTCADTANQKSLEQLPYANVIRQSNHDKYIAELARCHANVTNSTHETYCISIVESMQAKQLIIAPNDVTFPELLGSRYKYLFNNADEQLDMMFDAVNRHVTDIDHQNLDETLQIDIYRTLIAKCGYPKRPLDTAKHATKIKSMFAGITSITTRDAYAMLNKRLNVSTQAYPILKVSLLLEDLGFVYNRTDMKYEKSVDK